jgi:peptide-methionine (S)-S-oxide reductase
MKSRDAYQQALRGAGHGATTTEIVPAPEFFYAEEYHQQYLAKNPGGYCGLGGMRGFSRFNKGLGSH